MIILEAAMNSEKMEADRVAVSSMGANKYLFFSPITMI
jgi:hypothetical protein